MSEQLTNTDHECSAYRTGHTRVFEGRSNEITTMAWNMGVLCRDVENDCQQGSSLVLSVWKGHLLPEDHLKARSDRW